MTKMEGLREPCAHNWRYNGTDYHGSHKGEDCDDLDDMDDADLNSGLGW